MPRNISVVVWAKEGCSYCNEVKEYLIAEKQDFKVVDVTNHDEFRDILDIKYGVRHVPVVEIGFENNYQAVTEVGIEHLQKALQEASKVTEKV